MAYIHRSLACAPSRILQEILGKCTRDDRQTCLFSATLPAWVREVAPTYMRTAPTIVDLVGDNTTAASTDVRHLAIPAPGPMRDRVPTINDVIRMYCTAVGKVRAAHWHSMAFHGPPWPSMALHALLWPSMAFHGHLIPSYSHGHLGIDHPAPLRPSDVQWPRLRLIIPRHPLTPWRLLLCSLGHHLLRHQGRVRRARDV